MNNIKRLKVMGLALCAMTATAWAQVEGSALNYMLQRPRVSKTYEDKKLLDRLFVDMGGGVNLLGPAPAKTGLLGQMALGDWLSPEHGLRLQINGGRLNTADIKTKYMGMGVDYMLNLTALGQYGNQYTPRQFELYGIAGLSYHYSRQQGNSAHGLGVHLGIRGQMAMSPFTYLYIEPQIGVIDDKVTQVSSWHGYRPMAQVAMGMGYRLTGTGRPSAPDEATGGAAKGLFIGLMGGPTALVNSDPSTWSDFSGMRLAGSIGKWFDTTNALRLTVNGNYFKQGRQSKVKAAGVQLDYMFNLHNAFGGYNPDRWFWINGVAGVSYNYATSAKVDGKWTMGVGAGLQTNVRLGRELDLVVEPRIDIYGDRYVPYANSFKRRDAMGSVLAGLVYTYHGRRMPRTDDDSFTRNAWYDHLFVEAGVGANIPGIANAVRHTGDYMRPSFYMAVGKWFSPLHGVRLWGQLAQTQYTVNDADKYKHAEVGADYLLNLTNALYGYQADRKFDITGGLGANLIRREENTRLYLGLDASLRGTWHPNRMLGLFIEPRLQGYGDQLLPTTLSMAKMDLIASVMAGIQLNINAQGRGNSRSNHDDSQRSSIMIGGGAINHINLLRNSRAYSPVGKLAYTHWYAHTAAWRYSMQGYLQRAVEKKRYGQVSLGIDWMTDLTALTYGYDPQRTLSVNAFVGVNAGLDFGNGSAKFAPDVHAGGQVSLRLSDAVRLNLEPQLSYQMSSRWTSQSERVMPQLLLGLEYGMQRNKSKGKDTEAPSRRNVVMASAGVGTYSGSFREMSQHRDKLTFNADLGYGRWLSATSGVYGRVSNITAQRRGEHNQGIYSLQAGYMMNVKSAITGESSEDDIFQLTALVGASANVATRQGHSPNYAPGLHAAIQAGVRLTPQVEVYVEPAAAMLGKTIERPHKSYMAEGMAKISIGTKINF